MSADDPTTTDDAPTHEPPGDDAPDRRDERASTRQRLTVATAALALGAVVAVSARGASGDQQRPAVVETLQDEIDDMVSAGMSEDDPKVRMLQEELDALVDDLGDHGQDEDGVDLQAASEAGEMPDTPEEAAARADEVRPDQPAERGPVECEVVPQQLSADEVTGARCVSVPQPDGTSLYVVVAADGAVHIVEFGPQGRVQRLDNRRLPAGVDARRVELVPDRTGDLVLQAGGRRLGALDL
ncbi:MAG TPA: hypothetical protein VK306_11795 [Acidimicrobiales bacterium]|nr:hypothetical protein [Acidimicrobiales bacterium]